MEIKLVLLHCTSHLTDRQRECGTLSLVSHWRIAVLRFDVELPFTDPSNQQIVNDVIKKASAIASLHNKEFAKSQDPGTLISDHALEVEGKRILSQRYHNDKRDVRKNKNRSGCFAFEHIYTPHTSILIS